MSERLFSQNHIWVAENGGTLLLGITDYAQEKLGNIMFVNLPDIGDTVVKDRKFGDIESIKTVSDLLSPVDGEIVRINEELIDEPERINADPYACWPVEVKPACLPDGLVDEKTYLLQKDDG